MGTAHIYGRHLVRPGEDTAVDVQANAMAGALKAQSLGGTRGGLDVARAHIRLGILKIDLETGALFRSWRFRGTSDGGRLLAVRAGWERADVAHVRGGRCVELWTGVAVAKIEAHRVIFDACRGPLDGYHLIGHINGNPADNRPENLTRVTRSGPRGAV